ncbi:hypothetical protein CTRI78_v001417 [Colletotrichum trifolii]|uniref:Acyltransferase 3 domain-containing protein n=1 Tax=Colletotrichum trifolii TaxID=5466 RepID=A0A4R8RTX7_COLTR|nr:hypothetical protein CTRI78_v001417 [Colletotrichum trifolii]
MQSRSVGLDPMYGPIPVMDDVEQASFSTERYEKEEEEKPFAEHMSVISEDDELDIKPIPPRPLPPWIKYPKIVLDGLLPSFFHNQDPNTPVKPLHPTAYLDGIRGVAAFLVVLHHWSLLTFTLRIHKGYGSDAAPLLIQLPGIRLLVSGFWAVCVFFVVSGFSLSHKPLKLLGQGKRTDFAVAAASSAFRRYIRIFLPPITTTFIIACLAHFGCFEAQTRPPTGPQLKPPRGATWDAQLRHWSAQTLAFADPLSRNLRRGNMYVYDPVLWTIPVEFDCSLVVFLTHLAFSRLRVRVRLFFHAALVCYALYTVRWEYFLFLGGLLCADLHFFLKPTSDEEHGPASWDTLPLFSAARRHGATALLEKAVSATSSCVRKLRQVASLLSFALAIWLLSYPKQGDDAPITPGYRTLAALAPSQYGRHGDLLWIPLGAVLLVFTVDRSPRLQRIFTARWAQYLGRVSFAIYLVHNCMLWLVGWHLVRFFTAFTGAGTDEEYVLGVLLATCVLVPLIVCVADLAQRWIDARAVRFAAWVEGKLIGDVGSSG